MRKLKKLKGTVVEVRHNAARVQFPNGDSKWFTVNNDTEREHFALGKKLEIQQRTMPRNRKELFAYIREIYPKNVQEFLTGWSEGAAKRKGKTYLKMAMGAGLVIAKAIVFGSSEGKHFLVGEKSGPRNADLKHVSRHRYNKPIEIEQGLLRITELVNAKIAAKAA